MTRKILAIVVLMTTLFATSSFATGTEQPQTLGWRQWTPSTLPPPPPRTGNLGANCFIVYIGPNLYNTQYQNQITIQNFNAGLGYMFQLSNQLGLYAGAAYMQQSFDKTAVPVVNYSYKHLHLPVILKYAPSKYFWIGAGAQYSYLLDAALNGTKANLANNPKFQRSGVGFIGELNVGWSAKSPRLALKYTQQTGAAEAAQSFGVVDATIQIPIFIDK